MTTVGIIGAGYVGLATALSLTLEGHEVVCCERDEKRLGDLRSGRSEFGEVGVDEILSDCLRSRKLKFVKSIYEFGESTQIVFVCIGTPSDGQGRYDLSDISSVVCELVQDHKNVEVIVIKSTVPVGYAKRFQPLAEGVGVQIVSCPEFLQEGNIVSAIKNPTRMIIGGSSSSAISRVADLYLSGETQIFRMSNESAELTKMAANTFLSQRLSLVNEIATLAERFGAEYDDVRSGLASDERIGGYFLSPGPGWGGSCFPKDTLSLSSTLEDQSIGGQLVLEAYESNERQIRRVIHKIHSLLDPNEPIPIVTILGLAFKAGTNDTRDSPALRIASALSQSGVEVRCVDPAFFGKDNLTRHGQSLRVLELMEAVENSDLIAVLTEWPQFSEIDPVCVRPLMRRAVIADFRRVIQGGLWKHAGFAVYKLGSGEL